MNPSTYLISEIMEDNIIKLFEYGLSFLNETQGEPFSPAFHIFNDTGQVGTVMCDQYNDIESLCETLDTISKTYNSIVNMLVIVGYLNNEEIFGVIVQSKFNTPMFYYKPIIRNGGIVDLGPLFSAPCNKIHGLSF